ncbi:MAG: UDP-N-acetylenolpyruvoylglucosamine reductase [Micavibrio sp.]|nr:UDP-N-acetylenolpyruvoylglucosamine reductase [Micavibrio sp.]|tara:strand:+ start:935 stop:1903 length:969 start_codon:yes stop_codon:yes gene_type:complete
MFSELFKMDELPPVRGRYSQDVPIGTNGWFRAGGGADVLFKPADQEDLIEFLRACPGHIPVTTFGVLSNSIIRDGGVPGVVVRLGRGFAEIDQEGKDTLVAGAAALDFNVAISAARFQIAGLEFLSGIPGTIGGALRMNAGAYGTETKDVLQEACYVDRAGQLVHCTAEELDMSYRHCGAPQDAIFLYAKLKGHAGNTEEIEGRIAEIKAKREETQPVKARTGGSTFANPSAEELAAAGLPEDMKVWQLIDNVGGRGLIVGGAQMSEKHCNFMINTGEATAQDLEDLGEEIRRRVLQEFGITLRWEIRRIGRPHNNRNVLLQ